MQAGTRCKLVTVLVGLLALAGCSPVEDEDGLGPDAGSVPAALDASLLPVDASVLVPRDAAISDAAASDGSTPDAAPSVDATVSSADAGSAEAGTSSDPLESLRQVCVDTINGHRATLGLAPLRRASKTQESCSDQGAKKDGESMMAHSSAGSCSGLGAQNTCPSWKFGPGTGNATLEAALKRCLQQMWDEGMPPVPVNTCIADKSCFPKYGHWINMSSSTSRVVSCGFYDMGKSTYWMNQDFGR